MGKNNIAIVVSIPMVARVFLAHQINALVENYRVTIITNLKGSDSILDNISKRVIVIDLPIERNINLFLDLKALFLLIIIFYKNKFTLVHSVSPKAGLLAALASFVARVPNRVHTFTGQVWMTKKGISRSLLKFLDKIIVGLNTNILVDSFSQNDFLIKEGVIKNNLSTVLGNGSISGVDSLKFQPSQTNRNFIREELNIKNDCIIFLFLGRLKKEKGVFELVEAFKNVSEFHSNVALLIVGQDEEGIKQELISFLGTHKSIVKFVSFTKEPERYMAASDIFVLPSYREGFGSVVIEAACCGLPSIGSNIYGLSDAIKTGETGLLVSVRSTKLLQAAMLQLANDKNLRMAMGFNARKRAIEHFSQDIITSKILQFYKRLIN